MNRIDELERELRKEKEKEFDKRQEEIRKAKEKIPTSISWSDDYIWAGIEWFDFYYWYEETYCKKHKKIDDCEDRYDCEEREWCFTARINNKEVMRIPSSELSVDWNVEECLISWMLMFIKKYLDTKVNIYQIKK